MGEFFSIKLISFFNNENDGIWHIKFNFISKEYSFNIENLYDELRHISEIFSIINERQDLLQRTIKYIHNKYFN